MATADELLATLSGSEESKILLIDNDLRTINIPDSITSLGVEADDDVHRLYFQMPRMYGDTDLSTFNVRINYLNAKDEGDIYVVTDKNVLTSSITFSWLVGPHALLYKGDVKFIVCLKESDSDGNILREFNTTVATLPVLEGLEVDAAPLMGDLADVLEQLQSLTIAKVAEVAAAGAEQIAKVQEESSKQQDNIVNKGEEVLATIPEDYQTTYKLASEAVRTKADAIACEAEGDTIAITDSSDDYIRGLRLLGKTTQRTTTGKNLFNNTGSTTSSNGITFTVNANGSVTINGTATKTTYFELGSFTLANGEYWFSGCSDGSDTTYLLYLQKTVDSNGYVHITTEQKSFIVSDSDERTMYIAVYSGATVNNKTLYPMIRFSNITDTTYEPYTGGVPGPNPEYPQKLVSIGDDPISIDVHTAQLFNVNGEMIKTNSNNTVHINGSVITTTYTGYGPFRWKVKLPKYSDITVSCASKDVDLVIQLASDGSNGGYKVDNRITSVGTKMTVNTLDNEEFMLSLFHTQYDGTGEYTVTGLMINMGTEAAPWQPYENPQTLTIPRTLPGIPVTTGGNYTDSDGQQWICDEIDFERGVYVQRTKTVEINGSETWRKNIENASDNYLYWLTIPDVVKDRTGKYLCDKLQMKVIDELAANGNTAEQIGISDKDTNNVLYINVGSHMSENTVDGLKSWLANNHLTIMYILATPIETPLTAEEIAAFKALKTNYPNTTILNDAGAWMSVKYNADTKSYVDNPKTLRLTDSSTGVVYELKIVDGAITVVPV